MRGALTGLVILVASLWAGAYGFHLAKGSWAEFPVWATSAAGMLVGVARAFGAWADSESDAAHTRSILRRSRVP